MNSVKIAEMQLTSGFVKVRGSGRWMESSDLSPVFSHKIYALRKSMALAHIRCPLI